MKSLRVKSPRIGHAPSHDAGIQGCVAGISQGNTSGTGEAGHITQVLTGKSACHGPHRMHTDPAIAPGEVLDQMRNRTGVDRRRIRNRAYARDTARAAARVSVAILPLRSGPGSRR